MRDLLGDRAPLERSPAAEVALGQIGEPFRGCVEIAQRAPS
jgi:hypothetical protein